MKIIRGKDFRLMNTCVTIGKFDGIHIGHRSILNEMNRIKREKGLDTVVLTFDFSYFSPNEDERLNTREEKISLLESLGIDFMIDYPFDDETRKLSAEDFVRTVLVKRLGAKTVIIGENFRFGYKAAGDTSLLTKIGNEFGFETITVPCVNFEGSVVSSTRIRDEKTEGNIEKADIMLGRNG